MNSPSRAKMEKFIARKNPFDQIVITSDSLHPAKIRIGYDSELDIYQHTTDNPGYHPTDPLEGDADYLEEWLEYAYRLHQTVTYYFEGEEVPAE